MVRVQILNTFMAHAPNAVGFPPQKAFTPGRRNKYPQGMVGHNHPFFSSVTSLGFVPPPDLKFANDLAQGIFLETLSPENKKQMR